MLNLAATTDKLQLVTSTAATVDVCTGYADYASGPTFTPGRALAAISSATTTDIVPAPGASVYRNVKTMVIKNKHTSLSSLITVLYNANGTTYDIYEITLNPGDSVQYTEVTGWFVTRNANSPLEGASTSDQTASASDTYLSGSGVPFVGRVQAGSRLRWNITATKTGAGTATPVYNLRVGTAGTTSDTSRAALTGPAQTAVADTAWWDIDVVFRSVGASGVAQVNLCMGHNLTSTGFANIAGVTLQSTTAGFDMTVANSVMGWSFTPGTSGVWTIKAVCFTGFNMLT